MECINCGLNFNSIRSSHICPNCGFDHIDDNGDVINYRESVYKQRTIEPEEIDEIDNIFGDDNREFIKKMEEELEEENILRTSIERSQVKYDNTSSDSDLPF